MAKNRTKWSPSQGGTVTVSSAVRYRVTHTGDQRVTHTPNDRIISTVTEQLKTPATWSAV